ncbi:MAG TPA: peptide chain release factor N(5)-glutamine methyltransferase [Casimicrobiaceae bacterium]|nr:peptide chain release factor N(5)-glutamine methyltransferase [Casimicrobiaceae bacterium]
MTPPSTVSRALALSGLVPFEAKILLAHVLGRDRAWLAAHGDAPLSRGDAMSFDALARRRREGEPVAYLTGRREFYGLDLEITPDVLIPRPETELLVEQALAWIAADAAAGVLDLGCGSGAVALAIARERPGARVLGVDVAPAAVALAQRNAERLAIGNASFIVADWFDGVPREAYEVIVANPPYVAQDDPYLGEGDLRFEPPVALTPGPDALSAVRAIVAKAPDYLAPRGALAVEHGHDQSTAAQALFAQAGFTDVCSRRDLAGIFRVTCGRR